MSIRKNSKNVKNEKNKDEQAQNFSRQFLYALLILMALAALYSTVAGSLENKKTLSLSEVVAHINAGEVKEISVLDSELTIQLKNGETFQAQKEQEAGLTETLRNYNVDAGKLKDIKVQIETRGALNVLLGIVIPILGPVILIGFFIWFMARQVQRGSMQALTFGQSRARLISPDDGKDKVTFKDVAGVKEAKEELREVVDFLKNPKKFLDIGAKIPKGVLLMGPPGVGKCVTGDTLLFTQKGLIPIDEVPKYFTVREDSTVDGLDIVSLDPHTLQFKQVAASHWYNLGMHKTVKIGTNLGNCIEGTPEHPIVVVDQSSGNFLFKRLDEIGKGEWVVVGYDTGIFGSYTKVPDEAMAYLLGALTGDGCLTIKNRVVLSTADHEILSHAQDAVAKHFGKNFRKNSSHPYDYEIQDQSVKESLRALGLQETYAAGKRVPEWVRLAPKHIVVSFLRGIFDTDGYVERNGAVGFSSASKQLINDLHGILLNLGIVAHVYERKKLYNHKLQFYLSIYGDFLVRFRNEIGFSVERKQKRLHTLCERQHNTNVNLIPYQTAPIQRIWEEARTTTSQHLDRAFYREPLYKNIRRYAHGERMPSVVGMNTFLRGMMGLSPKIARMPEAAYLRNLSSGNFFFAQVKEISKGEAVVYDLTVPHLHNFLANGLINHNTMLARAVAGEAGVPFFYMSASEFIELFVGVGASRVRDLFKLAKKAAPSIIFVDELDAIGRIRGAGIGGGHDEREQTLNQILVEMDGMETNDRIIILAATNRPDVLDPALLRPGRFDRRVVLDLPDINDRAAILEIHSRNKPVEDDVVLRVIAERTPGFSGADLANLVNEAAILAAREDRKKVGQMDLIKSIEKVMLGPERKSHILSPEEKKIAAYHEAGHALVATSLIHADPVHKVSIVSRGRAAGYTLKLPSEDRHMYKQSHFLDEMASALGGYAAEKLVFGELTTGPSDDLQKAAAVARSMVMRFGMSDKVGPSALGEREEMVFLGRELTTERNYSEETARLIDAEVKRLIDEAYNRAREVLTDRRAKLDAIAAYLIEHETIERHDFEALVKE